MHIALGSITATSDAAPRICDFLARKLNLVYYDPQGDVEMPADAFADDTAWWKGERKVESILQQMRPSTEMVELPCESMEYISEYAANTDAIEGKRVLGNFGMLRRIHAQPGPDTGRTGYKAADILIEGGVTMRERTAVVVGGGVGGITAANELRRRLPGVHRVVLIERNPRHALGLSFLWVMVGEREPGKVVRDVHELVVPGVEVMSSEVLGIDPASRNVRIGQETISYDYLVVALGADLAPQSVSGLAEASHTFYTLEGAARLNEALKAFQGGKVAVVVAGVPYKCPAAPHEGAMLIADFFRRRGMRDAVELHVFTPEPQPMPVGGPALGSAVKQMLEDRGIVFHPQHKLASVDPEARELIFDGMEPERYDLLVAVPPHVGPALVREAGLANEAGWVPVDRNTLATSCENVYAVGDVTALSIPGRWNSDVPLVLPKAGVFAYAEALVAAGRIAAEVSGVSPEDTFSGEGFCMLESGEGAASVAYGRFLTEPSPQIELHTISPDWHRLKVLYERWWLQPLGPAREALRQELSESASRLGMPIGV